MGTISLLHHRTFERLENSNKFFLTILARELASDSIAFPNILSGDLSLQDLPVEIDDMLQEFVDVVPDELPSELPAKDSKRSFSSDFGFGSGTAKSLKYDNRVPYRGYHDIKTRLAKLQNLSNAVVSSRFGHILNPCSLPFVT